MENIRYNLISIYQNRNIRINNEINNRINTYKFIFSTIIYVYIIPITIFFLIKNNQTFKRYILPNINNYNNNIKLKIIQFVI